MSLANSTSRSLIIISKRLGWDPTEIVGEGNLIRTIDNPNGFTGIPGDQTPNKTFQPPAMESPDKPGPSPGGADPYPGMGKF